MPCSSARGESFGASYAIVRVLKTFQKPLFGFLLRPCSWTISDIPPQVAWLAVSREAQRPQAPAATLHLMTNHQVFQAFRRQYLNNKLTSRRHKCLRLSIRKFKQNHR